MPNIQKMKSISQAGLELIVFLFGKKRKIKKNRNYTYLSLREPLFSTGL